MPIPFTPQPNCLHTHSLHLFCCSHRLAGLHVTRAWLAALGRPCRTSISRMSSKEKITLHEREKHPPPTLQTPPTEEEEEESNTQSRSGAPSKASSSSSSEEESESESDAESGEPCEHRILWKQSLTLASSLCVWSPPFRALSTACPLPLRVSPACPLPLGVPPVYLFSAL